MKTIKATIPQASFARTYITLWNGMLGLTDKEMDLIEEFVNRYNNYCMSLKDTKLIYELLFSTQTMKEIRNKINMNEQQFNNYKSALKKKKVIHMDDDGNYRLDERVIPVSEITFKFEIQ
jgi:hypothetical protein